MLEIISGTYCRQFHPDSTQLIQNVASTGKSRWREALSGHSSWHLFQASTLGLKELHSTDYTDYSSSSYKSRLEQTAHTQMLTLRQVRAAFSFRIKRALIMPNALVFKINSGGLNEGHFNLELECLNRALMLFNQSYIIRFHLIWINSL